MAHERIPSAQAQRPRLGVGSGGRPLPCHDPVDGDERAGAILSLAAVDEHRLQARIQGGVKKGADLRGRRPPVGAHRQADPPHAERLDESPFLLPSRFAFDAKIQHCLDAHLGETAKPVSRGLTTTVQAVVHLEEVRQRLRAAARGPPGAAALAALNPWRK